MHRWLVRFLRVVDVRFIYAFAAVFVVPPTMLVNRKAPKVMYGYFRRRHGYGRVRAAWATLRNHCLFSQVVIDRFAMYAGKKFDIAIDGYEHFAALSQAAPGFVQLSSHIGNYEIAGYSLAAKEKRFNALVFGGEKASVMQGRSSLFDGNNIRMIAMQPDMSHLFTIDRALTDGEIVSMPADRVFGSQKAFTLPFLGAPAKFPQGPFVMAALRGLPMLFVAVMKEGARRYRISVQPLAAPDTALPSRKRAEALAGEYVRLLEATVRRYPAQWYNYFDFWA
ncbi:MAG: lysophospholipid acyltransferase family protein [Muribaculaceae bacterium]|nr:lysophospholipid acyltransferase family protein [Muribaculaceae bacterium]